MYQTFISLLPVIVMFLLRHLDQKLHHNTGDQRVFLNQRLPALYFARIEIPHQHASPPDLYWQVQHGNVKQKNAVVTRKHFYQ